MRKSRISISSSAEDVLRHIRIGTYISFCCYSKDEYVTFSFVEAGTKPVDIRKQNSPPL